MRAIARPIVLSVVVALCLVACGANDDVVAPEQRYPQALGQHVDPAWLERARVDLSATSYPRCLLVERNGVLVMEEYFNGSAASEFYDVRSVTKSVTSILIGIALDAGLIHDLDQTIGDYLDFPEIKANVRRISLRDLLTMTSGLPWREIGSTEQDYSEWVGSPDPLLWILTKPLEHAPGTYWHYNTGASHIPSAILTVATGQSALAFSEGRLFGPLESEVGGWPADPRGYNYGGHGIRLQGRTLVKLGRLYLDGGVYHGQRIVPASWVRESVVPRNPVTNDGVTWATGYGYFWWTGQDAATGLSYYLAVGYGGQFIVDVPSANAVIVATTAWYGVPDADGNFSGVLRAIVHDILPSLG